jgi:nitric oxide reductase subunit B
MEPLDKTRLAPEKLFITAGLVLMATGLVFGWIGSLQYLLPGFLKEYLSFERVRPLHVSSVVFWIILSAAGSVLCYVQQHTEKKTYSTVLSGVQLAVFMLSILAILVSYCMGIFGGREYWEFPPLLALPIVAGWILFIVNLVRSIGSFRNQPVYIWMWLTGACFFLFTFLESYLWVFPYFRNNVVNDMTIQWKSYGSMVGSWNMLIYGCSIFLMDKISGNKKYSHSKIAFVLYFVGLFNMMFNWGHHIYTLPTHAFVKHISYAVSMTELLILGRMLYQWKSALDIAKKHFYQSSYRFLLAADIWILLTLLLAIAMSIPAINIYTHGTHITVAHTMGATIGINSMLMLAVAFDILGETCNAAVPSKKLINRGYWTANIALAFFWLSLIAAGVLKAQWQMGDRSVPFNVLMEQLHPYFMVFMISGTFLTIGLGMVIYPILKSQWACYFKVSPSKQNMKLMKTEKVYVRR